VVIPIFFIECQHFKVAWPPIKPFCITEYNISVFPAQTAKIFNATIPHKSSMTWMLYLIKYRIYSWLSRFFGEGKGTSQKHLDLYKRHISYQLKERCFGPSLTHNIAGFNPIRARVGTKSSHRCLLIHYYSINNNFHQTVIWISQICQSFSVYVIILDSHMLLPTSTPEVP